MNHHKFVCGFPLNPSVLKPIIDALNQGYAYVYKRDRSFRPIFHINVNKLKKVKADPETLVNLSTFMI